MKGNFARNCVKMEFFFQSNSIMNSLKCPKSKSLSHCLTELFPIYQNKHWTIRRQDDCFVDPSCHRIILKIVRFQIKWSALSRVCFNLKKANVLEVPL